MASPETARREEKKSTGSEFVKNAFLIGALLVAGSVFLHHLAIPHHRG